MNIFAHKILATLAAACAALCVTVAAGAQERRDSVIYRQSAAMDSTLVGKGIFNLLSGGVGKDTKVTVRQSQRIIDAFDAHVASNSSRTQSGFRVRIFNDNKRTSRNDSEVALTRFKGMFPGVAVYRTYSNPFFRVTVGDFRTKSEAMQLLLQVKGAFPTAFIVKETIGYPVVDRFHSYTVEAVRADNQE